MKTERYLGLRPDGSLHWIVVPVNEDPAAISRMPCSNFYDFLNTNIVELVRSPYENLVMLVDEIGKLRDPVLPYNRIASLFYPGSLHGDPIVGSVVFGTLKPVPPYAELHFFPLDSQTFDRLMSVLLKWDAYWPTLEV